MGGGAWLYVYFFGSFFTYFSAAAFVEIFEEDNHSELLKKPLVSGSLWYMCDLLLVQRHLRRILPLNGDNKPCPNHTVPIPFMNIRDAVVKFIPKSEFQLSKAWPVPNPSGPFASTISRLHFQHELLFQRTKEFIITYRFLPAHFHLGFNDSTNLMKIIFSWVNYSK